MRALLSSPRTAYPVIFLLGLLVRLITMVPIRQPGYMDAYYYYHVASNLYQGKGFTEDFIWNYLAIPDSVTHPSNLYWMPLVSVLIYFSFLLFGEGFRAAQVPLVLLSAVYPLVAFWLGKDVFRNLRYAWTMALLTIFSGVAFIYWVVPDNFAPFALAGCLSLICCYRGLRDSPWFFAGAGALAGLGCLARPDGVLLLVVALVTAPACMLMGSTKRLARNESLEMDTMASGALVDAGAGVKPAATVPCHVDGDCPMENKVPRFAVRKQNTRRALIAICAALVSFALVISPWLVRNQGAFGTPWPSAGAKTLFLTEYNDVFAYGKDLTLGQYLDWGWGNILRSKGEALWRNLLTFGELLLFYMLPFALVGFYLLRRRVEYWPFFVYGVLLYLSMSLLFTFPGPRGSFLHSASALLPFLFGAAVCGLDRCVAATGRRLKHWNVLVAQCNFTVIMIIFAVLASAGLGIRAADGWDHRFQIYNEIAAWLATRLSDGELVMAVDPPGYYYSSGRRSIAVVNNDLETTVAVCRRYGVRYILLEVAHPIPWHRFYLGEEEAPDLALAGQVADVRIYEVKSEDESSP